MFGFTTSAAPVNIDAGIMETLSNPGQSPHQGIHFQVQVFYFSKDT